MRSNKTRSIFVYSVLALVLVAGQSLLHAQESYARQQTDWRAEKQKGLTKTDGWLSLAGLYWLKEGRNTVGGANDSDLVFPGTNVPPRVGVIDFHDGKVQFTAEPNVPVVDDAADSATVRSIELQADDAKLPTKLRLGTLSWGLIKRGDRYGIRLRDSANPALKDFTGRKWYPLKPGMRITARFTPYETPRSVSIPNVLGGVFEMKAPGLLTFTLGKQEYTLEPVLEDDELFIIFRDLTSGKTTYGAGRFLYADLAKDGKVVLDFNQAINPPCAFTKFATCPLPPARNWLKVAIPAGELKYDDHNAGAAGR